MAELGQLRAAKAAQAAAKAAAEARPAKKQKKKNLLVTPQVATILYDDDAVESDVVFSNVKVFM